MMGKFGPILQFGDFRSIDKKPLWNPFSGSCCSQVFSELNCTKFNWPRSTQVQFRTALTAVYAGVKNSWNSSIKVGGAVEESGRGSDTKIRAISQFGDFRSKTVFEQVQHVPPCRRRWHFFTMYPHSMFKLTLRYLFEHLYSFNML